MRIKPLFRLGLLALGITWVVKGFTDYALGFQILGYLSLALYVALKDEHS